MFWTPDTYETCEITVSRDVDEPKPCVFTGLVDRRPPKHWFSLGFAAFSHGFLRMSLAFFGFVAFF